MSDTDWDDEDGMEDAMDDGPALADLFPGFKSRFVPAPAGRVFVRTGGEGPPLLCLHGFPQSHVMWHRMAPELAKRFSVVMMDLRGYGWSSAPRVEGDGGGDAYSKRVMAREAVEVMQRLGHVRFAVLGHDRGARIGYRLALDAPGRVSALAMLDILPTHAVWDHVEDGRFPHWREMVEAGAEERILADPQGFLDGTLAAWSATGLGAFSAEAREHYARAVAVPERAAAMCADYRAGATLDRAADEADLAAGKTIGCPAHLVWGAEGLIADLDPLEAWQSLAPNLTGEAVPGGHFPAEEAPQETLQAVLKALAKVPA